MIPKWLGVIWAAIIHRPSNRLRQLALTVGVTGAVLSGLINIFPNLAQSSPSNAAALPSFEVASVKGSPSGENSGWHILPNRLTVRNILVIDHIERPTEN